MVITILDFVIYWTMILLPFSMAIAPAPMNVFMGILIGSFFIKKIIKKEFFLAKTTLNLPLFLLFVLTCVSIVHSINSKDTLVGGILRLLQYIFILFAMAEEVKDKKHMWKIVIAMMAGLVFASGDGVWQVVTGKDFVRGYDTVINLGLVRATGSFKDPNCFGVYVSALVPLALGFALWYGKGKQKALFILLSIVGLLGAIVSYSRPTLLAVYVALWFLGVMRKNKLLIGLLIIFTLASPFIAPKPVKEWAKQVDYNPVRFMCNDDRIAIFRNAFQMIKAHPIMGVGANTFMKNYKRYKEFPEYRNTITSDFLYAHNNFLHLTAELGFIGLGIFLWLLYALFTQSLAIYRGLKDQFLKILSLSLITCLIAFLVNGLTESSLYSSRVALIFWYLAGFSIALGRFSDADRPKNN